jgi:hypothetical protein
MNPTIGMPRVLMGLPRGALSGSSRKLCRISSSGAARNILGSHKGSPYVIGCDVRASVGVAGIRGRHKDSPYVPAS